MHIRHGCWQLVLILGFAVLSIAIQWRSALLDAQTEPAKSKSAVQSESAAKFVSEGIAVQFDPEATTAIRAGEDVRFRFRISETASGNPLPGLKPAAWLDLHRGDPPSDAAQCTKKIAAFLGDSLMSVPTVDLNSWYVLAMNEDASISVVNPRFGFGGSQLLSMVFLDSPAEDWTITASQERLFVSMPESNRVAIVDAATWKIVGRLNLSSRPGRIALQPDEEYLWIAHATGVTAFDVQTLKPVVTIPTGAGPHELAISADSRFVFVTNGDAGTVAVVDAHNEGARIIANVAAGGHPTSVTFSELSRAAYIANDDGGGIIAVSTAGKILSRIPTEPGVHQIRVAPGGRFLFAVNPTQDKLHIIDTSSNRIVQTGIIHGGPDQVTFTSTLAYIRRRSDATVLMVPLDRIGVQDAPLPLVDFTGGQLPFAKGSRNSPADSIVAVPGSNAVLVANPADRAVYYYQEGMAAPMGQFQNYGHEPRAVMVVNRGLEESPRGTYQTVARVPQAGVYDVMLFLDSPRVVHCFHLDVAPAYGSVAKAKSIAIRSTTQAIFTPHRSARLTFQVLDAATHEPIANLRDLRTLAFLQPGIWQSRQPATEIAPGTYEIELTPPSSGKYQIFFECPSLGLKFNSPHVLTFTAGDDPRSSSKELRNEQLQQR